MAVSRSFTDYVRKKYDNEFWAAAEQFIEDNQDYKKNWLLECILSEKLRLKMFMWSMSGWKIFRDKD